MNELSKKSKYYYLLFNLPIQLTAVLATFYGLINWPSVLGFYILVSWLGIQAGSHKLFTHKSWEPRYSWVKYLVAIISCFGMMGGPVIWASMHRWHHANSDTDKDPHSPNSGLIHAYAGWLLNPPLPPMTIVKDHIRDHLLIKIDKYCREIVLIGIVCLMLVDYSIAFSLMLAMSITFHLEMLVNTFLHSKKEGTWSSRNNIWLSLVAGGSTLHKNHHDNPANFTFSKYWYELDPSAWIIKILKK